MLAKNGIVINSSVQEDDLVNGDARSETRQDNDTQPWDEVQAQGVLEQRITNLVITLNKVEHKLRSRINEKGILSRKNLGSWTKLVHITKIIGLVT